jgi:hypothetical protein
MYDMVSTKVELDFTNKVLKLEYKAITSFKRARVHFDCCQLLSTFVGGKRHMRRTCKSPPTDEAGELPRDWSEYCDPIGLSGDSWTLGEGGVGTIGEKTDADGEKTLSCGVRSEG